MHPSHPCHVYISMPKKTKLKEPNEIIQNFNAQRAIQLYEFVSHQFLKFYRSNSIASMTQNLSYI